MTDNIGNVLTMVLFMAFFLFTGLAGLLKDGDAMMIAGSFALSAFLAFMAIINVAGWIVHALEQQVEAEAPDPH